MSELSVWDSPSTLVLVLGPPGTLPPAEALSKALPTSVLFGASSDGVLLGATVPPEDHFTLTIMKFEESHFVLMVADEQEEGTVGGHLGLALADYPLKGLFLMAAGGPTLANKLIRAINTHTQVPIIGGLAATDKNGLGWIMAGPRILQQSALVLGFMGQACFHSAVASGWEVDESFQNLKISGIKNNWVKFLNGIPALQAITKALGLGPKQLTRLKDGSLHFPFSVGMQGHSLVMKGFNESTGEVEFSGDLDHSGQHLALLKVQPSKMVRATLQASQEVCKGTPAGVVLFMVCSSRRQALGDKHQTELGAVAIHMNQNSDLLGWYSWGEVVHDSFGSRLQNLRSVVLNITEPSRPSPDGCHSVPKLSSTHTSFAKEPPTRLPATEL